MKKYLPMILLMLAALISAPSMADKPYPTCYGFGCDADPGTNICFVEDITAIDGVTTVEGNHKTGSLEACAAEGNSIVMFKECGIHSVSNEGPIVVASGTWIAGQTCPSDGDGIVLEGEGFDLSGCIDCIINEVVITAGLDEMNQGSFLNGGSTPPGTCSGLPKGFLSAGDDTTDNVVIDHVTMYHFTARSADWRNGAKDLSVINTLFLAPLYAPSINQFGGCQGFIMLIEDKKSTPRSRVTFHNTGFIEPFNRSPKVINDIVDFTNNYWYNPSHSGDAFSRSVRFGGYGEGSNIGTTEGRFINNYIEKGPDSGQFSQVSIEFAGAAVSTRTDINKTTVYFSGNRLPDCEPSCPASEPVDFDSLGRETSSGRPPTNASTCISPWGSSSNPVGQVDCGDNESKTNCCWPNNVNGVIDDRFRTESDITIPEAYQIPSDLVISATDAEETLKNNILTNSGSRSHGTLSTIQTILDRAINDEDYTGDADDGNHNFNSGVGICFCDGASELTIWDDRTNCVDDSGCSGTCQGGSDSCSKGACWKWNTSFELKGGKGNGTLCDTDTDCNSGSRPFDTCMGAEIDWATNIPSVTAGSNWAITSPETGGWIDVDADNMHDTLENDIWGHTNNDETTICTNNDATWSGTCMEYYLWVLMVGTEASATQETQINNGFSIIDGVIITSNDCDYSDEFSADTVDLSSALCPGSDSSYTESAGSMAICPGM